MGEIGMKLEITAHLYIHDTIEGPNPLLNLINEKVDRIMATQAELAAALNSANSSLTDIGTEVDKIGVETTNLQKNVADLTAALAAGGTTSPEVDAALAALQATAAGLATKVKAVDDLVPDAPVTP